MALLGVVDGVGSVVRGLLGGSDLVGRVGRIPVRPAAGLAGIVVVRLRLLPVVCGCLLLGGGVVEVPLGGCPQRGCGGVGLSLRPRSRPSGMPARSPDWLPAVLCWACATLFLRLRDRLTGLIARGRGLVGYGDCGASERGEQWPPWPPRLRSSGA